MCAITSAVTLVDDHRRHAGPQQLGEGAALFALPAPAAVPEQDQAGHALVRGTSMCSTAARAWTASTAVTTTRATTSLRAPRQPSPNVTLLHAAPYGARARKAVGLRLGTGSGVTVRDLLVTGFGDGAVAAVGRSALLFTAGESGVESVLLHRNGYGPGKGQLRGGIASWIDFASGDPELHDVRYFANPDPCPEKGSPAMPASYGEEQAEDGEPDYIGAFSEYENWLEEWTFFGGESDYDVRTDNSGE